jgi:hypothetical protein
LHCPRVGPRAAADCVEYQRLIVATQHRVIVEQQAQTPGVPYGDCFVSVNRYCLTSASAANAHAGCRLQVHAGLRWIKRCIMEAVIQQAADDGSRQLNEALVAVLRGALEQNEAPSPAVRQAGALSDSDVTAITGHLPGITPALTDATPGSTASARNSSRTSLRIDAQTGAPVWSGAPGRAETAAAGTNGRRFVQYVQWLASLPVVLTAAFLVQLRAAFNGPAAADGAQAAASRRIGAVLTSIVRSLALVALTVALLYVHAQQYRQHSGVQGVAYDRIYAGERAPLRPPTVRDVLRRDRHDVVQAIDVLRQRLRHIELALAALPAAVTVAAKDADSAEADPDAPQQPRQHPVL